MEKEDEIETINIRIIAIGRHGVGRRSLIKRFIDNTFEERDVFLGDSMRKTIKLNDNQQVKVIFYIHNSGETFFQLRPFNLKSYDGFILAYEVDISYTFESLNEAIEYICKYNIDLNEKPIILIGNKLDNKYKLVSTEEAQAFATNNGLLAFYETSAKKNINVNESLNRLIKKICEVKSFSPKKEKIKLKDEKKNINKVNRDKKKCIK